MRVNKLVTFVAGLLMSMSVIAQDATKFVVSSAPGGITHKYALAIAPVIAKGTNTRTVLEIRAGGEGLIAARYVNEFRNSQEVVLMIGTQKDWQASNQGLSQLDDFITVAYLGNVPAVAVSAVGSRCATLHCFLELSKSRTVSYGIAINSPLRPLIRIVAEKHGVPGNITEVPFKAGGEGVTAALGGHIDFAITPLEIAEALIDTQKLKVIATLGSIPKYETLSLRTQGIAVDNESKYLPHLFIWSNLTPNTQQVNRVRAAITEFQATQEFAELRKDFHIQLPKHNSASEVLKNLLAR